MKRLILSLFVMLCMATLAIAQNRTVSGTVTSRGDNLPIPGVSVKLVGATGGVITNNDGKYSISVPEGTTSLQFSFIGYVMQTRPLNSSSVINVALEDESQGLSEVVVTANAIKREKRTLGYSAPTLNTKELTDGKSASVIGALSGKVAGVNITSSSNTPGSSSRVVLRGGSSISGNNQALMVVDGVPIDNTSQIGGADSRSSVDFGNRGNDVNPDDVASITVLKGPAAAALYGSRASNGALIITTKSGAKGAKSQITFSTTNTLSSVLKLPDMQNEYGQGYYDEAGTTDANSTYINDPLENWSWGAPFTGLPQEWGQEINGVRQIKPYSAQKNALRDFFTTGFATDNNLGFSGGSEKSTFYLGLNAVNSNGTFPGDKDVFNKYNVRFNGTTELSNKLSAGVSFNYSKTNANQVAGGQAGGSVYNNVLQTPRDIELTQFKDLNNPYNGYNVNGDNTYGYYGAYGVNPYYIIENYDNLNDVNRLTGNFNINYKPTKWLNIMERVGLDTYSDRRRESAPKYSFSPADEAGNYDGNNQIENGSYRISQYNVNEVVHDLMVTATHKFSDDFDASLMVGNNIRLRNYSENITGTNASGGLVVPGWYNLANSNGPVDVQSDYSSNRRLFGLYADLNLSYKNMLFLQGTARNDWSSTLPLNNNSFFYPSVSLSFLFTEMLRKSSAFDFLDYGKIRTSYAMVGNDTDPYQLLTTYRRGEIEGNFGSTTFPFGNVSALMANTTLGNAALKPEKTTSFEIGTELGFLKNRISVDFSYYMNNSKNQILAIPTPASTGYGFAVVNAGEIQNKGIELSLRGTPIKTSYGLTVELNGTFTKNNSKVVELMDGVSQINLGGYSGMAVTAAVGKSYGEFYGVTEAKDAEGRTIVDATTGIPVTTSEAQYLGSYNPKYQASLGTTITYKNLSLGVLFDTKHGGVFYSRTKDIMAFVGTSAESGGQRMNVIYPNSVYLDDNGNSVVNTTVGYNKQDYYPNRPDGANIVDATYVKLRNMSLTYTFNKAQLKKSGLGALSVGVFGNNLFIWTPDSNQYADPEVNSAGAGNVQGFDFTAQPSVRSYGLNVKVSF